MSEFSLSGLVIGPTATTSVRPGQLLRLFAGFVEGEEVVFVLVLERSPTPSVDVQLQVGFTMQICPRLLEPVT